MKVRDRMSTDVKTVTPETSYADAVDLMKERSVRRLPIIDKGKVVGIVTLSDLNKAGPSIATSLSRNEISYLLAKTTIKDIMPKHQELISIEPDRYIETAAKTMRRYKISGLPVVENGVLVGIITESDIFDALIDVLGVQSSHTRIDLHIEDRPGELAAITGIAAAKNKNIINTVMFMDHKVNKYKLILRMEEQDVEDMVAELKAQGYAIESVIIADEETD